MIFISLKYILTHLILLRVLSLEDVEFCQVLFLYPSPLTNHMVVNEDLSSFCIIYCHKLPSQNSFCFIPQILILCVYVFIGVKITLISLFFFPFVLLIAQEHGVSFSCIFEFSKILFTIDFWCDIIGSRKKYLIIFKSLCLAFGLFFGLTSYL